MRPEDSIERLRDGEVIIGELGFSLSMAFDRKFGELASLWRNRFRVPARVLINSTLYREQHPPVGVDVYLVFRRVVHKGEFRFLIRTEEERLEGGVIITRSSELFIEYAGIDLKADAALCLQELECQLERARGVEMKDMLRSINALDQSIRSGKNNGSG